jgi:hypothetical protein
MLTQKTTLPWEFRKFKKSLQNVVCCHVSFPLTFFEKNAGNINKI